MRSEYFSALYLAYRKFSLVSNNGEDLVFKSYCTVHLSERNCIKVNQVCQI